MPAEKSVTMPTKKNNEVYENWTVYSSSGKLMFRCNNKKADWYLSRQLAKPHPSRSKSIQLTFEAKGQGHAPGDYMVEDRVNCCVACGGSDHLTLHHVVPDMYRRWMPLTIKSKSGWIQVPEYRVTRKAASALAHLSEKIPPSRQEQLTHVVQTLVKKEGWENLEWKEILDRCCKLKDTFQGPDFVEHGEYVVSQLLKQVNQTQTP
ncbi:hypothetical protein BDF14DRAFT_1992708 [Spinellus fusiger]|nr:hypothetical protein BDF14DRAFT_1992708 [Spinellus fusiger]